MSRNISLKRNTITVILINNKGIIRSAISKTQSTVSSKQTRQQTARLFFPLEITRLFSFLMCQTPYCPLL